MSALPYQGNLSGLAARFRRLAARQGKKRALVVVRHTILVRVYHVLKAKRPYGERGAD
jgi:transposase